MKKILNLKLYMKFVLTFSTILVLVLILGLSGIFALSYANSTYYKAINSNNTIVKDSMELTKSIADMRRIITGLAYKDAPTEQEKQDVVNLYNASKTSAEKYLEDVKALQEQGEDRQESITLIEDVLKSLDEYYVLYEISVL